ncbi:MAG TPA: type III-A CRISPR-associated protein Cas10/Csm1 [Desulfomonilia bacterium]
MDETTLKIALAGFMHDIGKLAQEGINVLPGFINDNSGLYQPEYNGVPTHRHAVYTAAFIDHIEKLLPDKFNKSGWGLDDTFINLAAGHHKPGTPMQWIIAMADRISSGWDRQRFDEYNKAIAWQDYRKTRLETLFENALQTNNTSNYAYPLKPLSPENIFPDQKKDIVPSDDDKARVEYKNLFDEFVYALERLHHKDENTALWFEHLDSLMMIFTTCIPAARAGKKIPDISLYDHSRMTSAFASALYLYHKGNMDLQIIQDYEPKKFLLITGDLYGIQSFISGPSGDSGENRSKILRGRSFAVSLFAELAADMLCRKIGLPHTSVILNAAGKFTILAPNTEAAKSAVEEVREKINNWFLKISFGETAIGISVLEASPNDFVGGNFSAFWDRLGGALEVSKFRKLNLNSLGAVEGYLDSFNNELDKALCPYCGKRPSDKEVEGSAIVKNGSACKICRDHIFLGANLVKNERIAITTVNADLHGDKLLEPVFGEYQIGFTTGALNELARRGSLLKYWDISINEKGEASKDVTAKFINGYVPKYSEEDQFDDRLLSGGKSEAKKLELIEMINEGAPKTFSHISKKALNPISMDKFSGIEALGVLKADVDNLGMIMSCGIEEKLFTASRLASLSRQMNQFFSLWLPWKLKTDANFQNVYTVFAGGDDLFLIGPWNRIIELAGVINEEFGRYTCGNPEIHLSAGITIERPNTPVDSLAYHSEEALGESKGNGRNSITIFGETMTWNEFNKLKPVKEKLLEYISDRTMGSAMLYRMNYFMEMAQKAKDIIRPPGKNAHVSIDDMQPLKWRALFNYSASRNIAKDLKDGKRDEKVNEFIQMMVKNLENYGSKLKAAVWEILYNRR